MNAFPVDYIIYKTQDTVFHRDTQTPRGQFSVAVQKRGPRSSVRNVERVRKVDNAIHRINRSSVDKYSQNKSRYPLQSDLSAVPFQQSGPEG